MSHTGDETSTLDPSFVATAEEWLHEAGDLLVLRRFSHAAGARDWYLVRGGRRHARAGRVLSR